MPDPVVAAPTAPAESKPAEGAKAPEAKPAPRTYKVPFPELGEIELPESDVVGVLTQFAKMSTDDLKASKWKKEVEESFSDDDKLAAMLKKYGKDPEAFAEALLSKSLKSKVEESTLTAEQKEAREWKAKYEAEAKLRKADEDAAKARKLEEDTKVEYEKLANIAMEALKQTDIPAEFHNEPFILRRLGQIMKRNAELQYNVSPLLIAKQLEAEFAKEFDYSFKKLTPEKLVAKLGRKGVEALIKLYAEQMKGGPPAAAVPAPKSSPRPRQESPEVIRRKSIAAQYERAREEQTLLRHGAQGRETRYYGVKSK